MHLIINNKQVKFVQISKLTSGFTLVELLLVVAMLGIVAMFGMSINSNFLWRTDLSAATSSTVASLRHAQLLAQTQTNDMDWGVHIENNELTIFQGNNFINRDITKDEKYDLGSVVVVIPIDVVYHKFSGYPYQNSSEINLTTNQNTSTIMINEVGTISY